MNFWTTVWLRVAFVTLFFVALACRQIAAETSWGVWVDTLLSMPMSAWGVWVAVLVYPVSGYVKNTDVFIRPPKDES